MQQALSTIDDVLDTMLAQQRPPNILLGEDDDEMRALVAGVLRREGYDLIEAQSGIDLIRAIDRFGSTMAPLDLIITDVRMPGFTGIEALEYLRYSGWYVPVIVMTGFGDARTHAEAWEQGARAVFDKPFDIDELVTAVHGIVAHRRQPAPPRSATELRSR